MAHSVTHSSLSTTAYHVLLDAQHVCDWQFLIALSFTNSFDKFQFGNSTLRPETYNNFATPHTLSRKDLVLKYTCTICLVEVFFPGQHHIMPNNRDYTCLYNKLMGVVFSKSAYTLTALQLKR